ncbi:uncharacterized protein FA14DRAFT_187932 [Meira miltonrushii]|uniref:PH domain-containing protein n=1 Tax=Meira miltonrushii TaxID=1280837 RepID=A0A316VJW2_9BASI|nr:uncharacterized protein FA14DRAFT_187932 [Meira miltonrushii]PWN37882.1 hypothetical protein FA14DRAFT_187932 [Meira miltonrushii]
MSAPPSSMPSWQSMQRNPAGSQGYSSQSPPPSSYRPQGPGSGSSGDYVSQQQQPFPGNQPRFRPSTAGSSSSSSGPGRSIDRSNSYLASNGNAPRPDNAAQAQQAWPSQVGPEPQTPPATQSGQPQSHKRTQSLRPMSAFQPLENVDGPYASPNPSGRPPSPTESVTRSIRTAAAPLTFKSPELRSALGLQEAQSKKIYMEGYLSKRDHLTPDGKPLPPTDPKKRWQLCFVQLCGTVLSVWNVHQMEEAARQGREVPPSYINVTDSFVDFIGTITESPQDVPGSRGRYENVFAINTAGQNRILFGVEGSVGRRLVQAWVNGIRLATWEKVRLEEIYTGSLVRARLGAVGAQQATSGPGGAPGDVELSIKSPLNKQGKMEGWVKARFMGSTEWRKCWLVLSDRGAEGAGQGPAQNDHKSETASVTSNRNSFWSKLKAGDRGSLIGSPSAPALSDTGIKDIDVPPGSNGAPGLACFYETKKSKKPFATMAYASQTFAVYPSRPELVEGSSLFKVEGAFPLSGFVSATNKIRQSGWVMIMPELDSGSNKGANAEMMKWCIAFMDAFRLYGRPAQFQWDARNPISPFFAYPIGPYKDRLFLDRELSEFLDIREERHLANRHNLHGIMAARMRGERTPILPPLPQPNTESTRGLNGPGQANGNRQSQMLSSPPPQQDAAQAQQQPPQLHTALPPLNTGSNDQDAYNARGTQLSSIGERSREGSVMTNFTQTPVTPGTATNHESANDRREASSGQVSHQAQPSSQASQQSAQQVQPTEKSSAHLTNAASLGVSQDSQATSTNYQTSESSQIASKETAKPQPPIPASVQPVVQQDTARMSTLPSTKDAPRRKDSDPMGQYDEGALYFINSLGESLPSTSPKVNLKPLPPKEEAKPVVNEPAKPDSIGRSTVVQDTPKPVTRANPEITTPGEEGLDSDARAAYSFLDRPPSPPVSSSNSSRVAQPDYSTVPAAASIPAATSYPSSFNANKKAQERKLAAQAQAQAHSDALTQPGRQGGAKKSGLGQGPRHAWNDEEDEDEDDEEDEDESSRDIRPNTVNNIPASSSNFRQPYPAARQNAPYNAHLAGVHNAGGNESRGSSPGASFESGPAKNAPSGNPSTLVHLSKEEQPGAISTAFQPQGLLQAGAQDKAERSAKHVEAEARATGGHFVNVDANRNNAPQSGLVGAISAHERERRKEGGLGATLTERERERVQAEKRQREEEMMRNQMMQQQQQMMAASMASPQPGQQAGMPWQNPGMPPSMGSFNPMMWQQMQMMSMMNPMMFGGGMPGQQAAPGSHSGHGHQGGSGSGNAASGGADYQQQQMAAQMRAAQAAQQAYLQAMQQGGGGGGEQQQQHQQMSPQMPPMSMGMMPFNPYMSMYGAPMGFPPGSGFGSAMGPGSEMGGGHGGSYMMTSSPSGAGYASPNGGMHSPSPPPANTDPRSRQR